MEERSERVRGGSEVGGGREEKRKIGRMEGMEERRRVWRMEGMEGMEERR